MQRQRGDGALGVHRGAVRGDTRWGVRWETRGDAAGCGGRGHGDDGRGSRDVRRCNDCARFAPRQQLDVLETRIIFWVFLGELPWDYFVGLIFGFSCVNFHRIFLFLPMVQKFYEILGLKLEN